MRSIQAELHKEEANSKAILEASPVPLILIEKQDRISYLNNAFVEQIGYNRDEIPTWQTCESEPTRTRSIDK